MNLKQIQDKMSTRLNELNQSNTDKESQLVEFENIVAKKDVQLSKKSKEILQQSESLKEFDLVIRTLVDH